MTIPISGGSGGSSLPPVSGFTAIDARPSYPVLLPGLLITQDSLEESSSSIPIIAYARAINEAIDQLKEQLGASAVQDQEVSKKFFGALIQRATLLQQLYYEVKKAASLQEQLIKERNEQIKLINDQIDLYNEGVTSQYLGSWEDLNALRNLYAATLSFIDPSSSNYLNKTYMNQQVDLYGSLTGSPMETLKTAVTEFYDPKSPYYNDFIRLGGVLQQYFFQYDNYVVPANEQTAVDTWAAFFNPDSALYGNLGALDSAIKAYAPFLDPSYTLIVEPDPKEINEQAETERVNQAIADFNDPMSVYYQDTDYLALIYSQYSAYREGTLDDVKNAINAYFSITNRTPEDLDNLDEILRAYHRYIEGAPDIIASLDAYDHDLSLQIQAMIDNHNALVPLTGGTFAEQTVTDSLEASIAAYYNTLSPYYSDEDALQEAINKYNAYRQGTLADVSTALSAFFTSGSPSYQDVQALDPILRAYHPFITGTSNILNSVYGYYKFLSQQMRSQISTFNSGVTTENSQITALNNAIASYNDPGIIPTAPNPNYHNQAYLQAAYDTYNAYKATRDAEAAALNTSITAYNNDVQHLPQVEPFNYVRSPLPIPPPFPPAGTNAGAPLPGTTTAPLNPLLYSAQTAINFSQLSSALATYQTQISASPTNYLNRNAAITEFNAEMPEWYNYYNLLIGEQPIKDWITFTPRVLLPPPPSGFPPLAGSTLPDRIEEPDLPDQTDPPAADIDALEADIQAYLAYLNTNPPNELNRNADIELLNDYIDQYNAAIAANNEMVDEINGTRGKLKLKNLTKQQPVDYRDLLPLAPTIYDGSQLLPGRDLYPRVPLITEPTENDTSLMDAFNAEFDEALLFIGTMSQQLSLSQVDIDYALFVYQGGNLMNPLALDPDLGGKSESGGGVAGMGYGSTALDLSNVFVEAVLSTALLEAAYKAEGLPDSPEAIEAMKIATLQLLQDVSLVAGAPSVAFLAGALPSISLLPYLGIDEAAVSVVFAVEYARQVRNVLLSDVPQQTIQALLASDPAFANLTPEQIANIVGSISASLATSLGLVSLVQISIALGTPGLAAQLLSLLPGIQALGVNSLSPPIFQDFVGNGFTNSLVGSLLIGSGLDQSAAGEALRAALASGPSDPNSFFNALQKALAAAGVAPSEAISLALDATLLVLQQSPQANFTQGELDRTLMPGVIDQKMLEDALLREFVNAGEIAAAVFKTLNERNLIEKSVLVSTILEDFRFSDELTRGLLRANLLGEGVLRDSIVRDIITQNVIRNDLVLRDIRNALVQELINRNYDIKRAFDLAQNTIDQLREDYRLSLRMEQAYVDQEVLKNSIQQSFIQRGIQEDEAIRRAEIVMDNLQSDRDNFAARSNVRAAIRDILVEKFGVDRQQAGLIAAGVDLGIPPAEPVSLFNPGVGSMTVNEILIALETRIVALLGGRLSVEKTEELIDRLKGIVLTDDNSLRHIIDRSASLVVETQNEELIRSLVTEIRELTKPTREIFAFMEKLRDPGNSLIYSVWSGIMYAQDQPSNYKRDIDIHV
ncbi:hypothetical protein [Estrella lausannensis]|uniref:Uncharacterized protein n=1 Tax=Estrella lausannensis TaxID=483423 RepID=A0A0H5E787_9BACT|nr:hypothetical protein [Estrella lausannensis]CRX39185.1 hypothetical protein ELAC_1860 [Estrella lausannensis]